MASESELPTSSSVASTPAASQDTVKSQEASTTSSTITNQHSASNNKSSNVTYRCSAPCNRKIRNVYEANLHPLLGVLLCRQCFTNYGDGDFSKFDEGVDEAGDDNYCRWCCDGGDLLGCYSQDENGYNCHYVFCKECIQKNLPDEEALKKAESQDDPTFEWICYVCNPSKLDALRQRAADAMKTLAQMEFGKTEPVKPVENSAIITEPETNLTEPELEVTQSEPKMAATMNSSEEMVDKTQVPIVQQDDAMVTQTNGTQTDPVGAPIIEIEDEKVTPAPDKEAITPTVEKGDDVETPMSIVLCKSELNQRLSYYSGIKESCMCEISSKFDLILKAFQSEKFDEKLTCLVSNEIESLRRPLLDFDDMLDDLQNLSRTFASVAVD